MISHESPDKNSILIFRFFARLTRESQKILIPTALRIAANLTLARPRTRKCFTSNFLSYSDIVSSTPDRHR